MNFKARSFIVFVTYFLSILQLSNVLASTSKSYPEVYSEIESSQNLVDFLTKNNLSVEKTAKKFLEAAKTVKAQTGSVNWGSLAICVAGDVSAGGAGGGMFCSTFTTRYFVMSWGVGGFSLSITGAVLYISFKNPNQNQWCFKGAQGLYGVGPTVGAGGGFEANCIFDGNAFTGVGDIIEGGGSMLFVKGGFGAQYYAGTLNWFGVERLPF
ncbi:MAG: hypothetical protein QE271_08875 [Bacteriovoracaceae bacterium]|nr:hypothetical protein [Bacteriovoracaceae bacterium]